MLAGDLSPRHEARPLLSSPAPNLRKPVLAFALCGAVLLVPLALSGPGGAPGAGEEVVLSAGPPDSSEPDGAGDDGELFGTVVDAGVAAQSESSAVSVEVQPAEVPEPRRARPAASTATTGRVRPLTARAATLRTTGPRPPTKPTATTATTATIATTATTTTARAPATTAAPPRPTTSTTRPPTPRPPAAASSSSGDAVWDRLAQCESGNTNDGGAPYYGYWQFSAETWQGLGEVGLPNEHSRERQLAVAKRLQAASGWSPWPGCSRLLGLL